MLPVLITIENVPILGSFPISSFGLFLILAILGAIFVVWRIVRVYEIDAEKVLDLSLVTVLGGFIGARLYFVIFNIGKFGDFYQVFYLNKYPGLSFWGALLFGYLTLAIFTKKLKLNFWQMADFAAVGLFLGIIIASFGCLLGSCEYGKVSNLPIAVTQVGLIGKRFPLQIIEAVVFLFGFFYLWSQTLKFHFDGQIASKGLIFLGIWKFILEFFRGDSQKLDGVALGLIWSLFALLGGIYAYYLQSKRSMKKDIRFLLSVPVSSSKRQLLILKLRRNWYNARVNWRIALSKKRRRLTKFLNVKSNPTQF